MAYAKRPDEEDGKSFVTHSYLGQGRILSAHFACHENWQRVHYSIIMMFFLAMCKYRKPAHGPRTESVTRSINTMN